MRPIRGPNRNMIASLDPKRHEAAGRIVDQPIEFTVRGREAVLRKKSRRLTRKTTGRPMQHRSDRLALDPRDRGLGLSRHKVLPQSTRNWMNTLRIFIFITDFIQTKSLADFPIASES